MWWKLVIVLFITLGVGVALLSTYKASVEGLMSQVGLVNSDFSSAVVTDKLRAVRRDFVCNLPSRIKGAITFTLSGDDEQGALSFQLGESRINCGAQMLSDGDTEAGTYEILKGFGYLTKGYTFVQERATIDRRACATLPEDNVTQTVATVLEATNGKVYELLWSSWQDLLKLKLAVEDVCLDQRNRTR